MLTIITCCVSSSLSIPNIALYPRLFSLAHPIIIVILHFRLLVVAAFFISTHFFDLLHPSHSVLLISVPLFHHAHLPLSRAAQGLSFDLRNEEEVESDRRSDENEMNEHKEETQDGQLETDTTSEGMDIFV